MAEVNKEYGHYTDQKGMMGIINSGNLWATNIKYLNDEGEFLHAIKLIMQLTQDYNENAIAHKKEEFKDYIDKIEKEISSLYDSVGNCIFTVSFTEETDLLSQWRGYCPDNNGFCITIDVDGVYNDACKVFNIKDELFESLNQKNVYLFDCVYDDKGKCLKLKELLNKYWALWLKSNKDIEKKNQIDSLVAELILLASHFKDKAFSAEKEKRIVVNLKHAPDANIKYRGGKFSIVPYIELPLPKELINKIIIGPCLNQKLSRLSLDSFMGRSCAELSSIPYRSH